VEFILKVKLKINLIWFMEKEMVRKSLCFYIGSSPIFSKYLYCLKTNCKFYKRIWYPWTSSSNCGNHQFDDNFHRASVFFFTCLLKSSCGDSMLDLLHCPSLLLKGLLRLVHYFFAAFQSKIDKTLFNSNPTFFGGAIWLQATQAGLVSTGVTTVVIWIYFVHRLKELKFVNAKTSF